jgi:hypothetical protein
MLGCTGIGTVHGNRHRLSRFAESCSVSRNCGVYFQPSDSRSLVIVSSVFLSGDSSSVVVVVLSL